MCNEYQLILPFDDVIETFNRSGDPLTFPGGMPNFGPMASIRIGDRAPVITLAPDGPALIMTPWAWKSLQGRPVFNFRSDDRSFAGAARCLIPADGFFEFTDPEAGQKRKTKWRFAVAGEPLFWVAGLVRDGAFAMLTTEPGPDIAPYHDRQIVVLRPEEGAAWLHLQRPEAELLRAGPAGTLTVEKIFPPRPTPERTLPRPSRRRPRPETCNDGPDRRGCGSKESPMPARLDAIDPVDRHVGARVREERARAGLTQTALGAAIGVTFQQVQKYERGTNRVSASMLVRIAEATGAAVGVFFPPSGAAAEDPPSVARHRGGRLLAECFEAMSPHQRDLLVSVARTVAGR